MPADDTRTAPAASMLLRELAENARAAFPEFPWSSARHMSFATIERGEFELGRDPVGDFLDACSPDVVLALIEAAEAETDG